MLKLLSTLVTKTNKDGKIMGKIQKLSFKGQEGVRPYRDGALKRGWGIEVILLLAVYR